MAKSVNKVILVGHLGKDPEVRYTTSGMAVANFSVATNDRYKDKEGQWQDRTEWHAVKAFDRTAEICKEYLHKGSQVYIEGKLQTSSWDDKNTGEKKYKTEILINELVLLGGRGGEGRRDEGSRGASSYDQRPAPVNQGITDEDVPF